MSKLKELIQRYCPDGVEWRAIGEVCQKVFAGGTPTSSNSSYYGGDIPWLRSGEVNFNEITSTEKTITEAGYNSSSARWVESQSVLVAMTGATVARSAITMIELTANQSVCALVPIREILNYRFLCYWVSKSYRQMKGMAQGALTSLNLNLIKSIELPVPPLPVQEEIVRVLDAFTELQAELQAELQKRLQQYNYYRDNLLSFEGREDIEWKKLGDVMTIQRGASPRPIQNFLTDDENGVPWIKIGDVSPQSKYISSTKERVTKEGASKSRYLKKGSFILSNSMSFGRPYILEIDGCIHDGWISMCDFQKSLNPDFLYHVLRSYTVQSYWVSKANNGGAVANLNSDIVRDTLIPIPSFKEQQKVVDVLDRFNALTSGLSQGLPAEIEKRRQQYEYYRDLLLTFKRAN